MPDQTVLLGDELIAYLHQTFAAAPQRTRFRSRWVMNLEWFHEVLKASPRGGTFSPLVLGTPETIFGLLIDIRPDGGVPHLEPPSA